MVAALIADGFRNYLRAGHRKPAEELLVERANMLTLTAPEGAIGSPIDGLELHRIKLPEARRKGFEIADFSIHFEGYCPECRRKKTKALSPRAGLRREK